MTRCELFYSFGIDRQTSSGPGLFFKFPSGSKLTLQQYPQILEEEAQIQYLR